MPTFDDRERAFEAQFKQDQDLQFKVINRRNRLLGQWVAAQLNKVGPEADAYAKEVVMSDFDKPGHEDVVKKVLGDLEAAGKPTDAAVIREQMEKLRDVAKRQIQEESK